MKRFSLLMLVGLSLAACAPSAEWGPGLMHWELTSTMAPATPMTASADVSDNDQEEMAMDDQVTEEDQGVMDDESVSDAQNNLLEDDVIIIDR